MTVSAQLWLGTLSRMVESTCVVLTPLYSVIVLAVVINRRSIHVRIRKEKLFQWSAFIAAMTAILGIVVSVSGVQVGGLKGFLAVINWTAFSLALAGLTVTLFAIIASSEMEEESVSLDGDRTD